MKAFHLQTKISFENLVKLESCGLYEQALAELKDVWRDTNEPPDISAYAAFEAAEIILRCGSLIGFHGHNKQIPDAQEKSKNLLTEARQRFLDFGSVEKVAECENYWRLLTGEPANLTNRKLSLRKPCLLLCRIPVERGCIHI
jgi:hypothetical protein